MKRLLKWTSRILGVVALLALILLVLGVTVLPGWVEEKAVSALREAGFAEAGLEVRYLGMRGAGVSAIALGAGERFAVDQVLVDYGLSGLLDGRVEAVAVSGVRWRVAYRDGVFDWAPFSELKGGDEESGELPFERVVIRSGQLQLDWEEKSLVCAIEGKVEKRPARGLGLDLRLAVAGAELAVSGTTDLESLAMDLLVTGGVADLAVLANSLPTSVAAMPGRPGGQLRLEVKVHGTGEALAFEARGKGESLSWFGEVGGKSLGARQGTLDLSSMKARLADGRFTLEEAGVEASCDDVRLAGLPPLRLSVTADHSRGNGTQGRVRLLDPKGEESSVDLSATVRGDVMAATKTPVAVGFEGSAALRLLRLFDPAMVPRAIVLDDDARLQGRLAVNAMPPAARESSWRLGATGEISLATSQVRLPDIGARLRGVRLKSGVSFAANDAKTEIALNGGSRLTVDRWRVREIGGRPRIESRGPEALTLEVTKVGRFEIAEQDEELRVTGSLGELSLAARGIELRSGEVEARDLGVSLIAGLGLGEETISLRARPGSTVRLDGAISAPRELEVKSEKGRPLAEVLVEDEALFEWERARPEVWRFEGPATRLRAGGTARLLRQGMIVDGFDFEAGLAAAGLKDGVELALREGGLVRWESVRSERGDFEAAIGAGHLGLSGREGAARFRIGLGEEGSTVRGSFVARCPEGFAIDDPALGSVEVGELSLDSELRAGAGGWKTEIAIGATAKPRLKPGATGAVEVAWEDVLDLRAKVVGRAEGDAANGARWELELDAATRKQESSLLAKWADGEVIVGKASVRARAELSGDRPAALWGEVKAESSEFFFRPAALTVSDVAIAMPFAFGTELAGPGSLSAETIWLGDDTLPEVSGEVGLEEGRLELAVDWEILAGATAKVRGWLLPLERIPRGELAIDLPTVAFDDDTQPGEVLSTLSDYVFGGDLSLAARIGIDGPRITPDLRLNLKGVSVSSEVLELEASGIDAEIAVDGLTPLSTPGAQRIRIAKGVLGKLGVDDGELLFRLESAHSLFIEEASFGWVGGRLYTHAVRFDPAKTDLDLVVYADHLQLDRLLELLAEDQATGTGTLYGRLPVQLKGTKISYGEAFLYAEPGLGELAVLDPEGYLDNLPQEARGALKDFQYSVLKLKFDPAGEKDATLRVRGRSRDRSFPREVILDVNIDGFKDLLDGAIIVQRMSKGVQGR